MGLPIKGSCKQLETTTHMVVWPGDDAVDLEASDLEAWVDSLGQQGLVIRAGAEPALIEVRPLTPREINRVQREVDQEQHSMAAKYGVIKVQGLHLSRDRLDNLGGLSQGSVDLLMHRKLRADIPWVRLLDVMLATDDRAPLDVSDELRAEMVSTELGYALGAIVEALSFRRRRSS